MRKIRDVVLCGILMILIAGCGSGGSGSSGLTDTESATAYISVSGGSLTTPGGDASLNVPAGALSGDQSITVSPNSKVTPPGNISGAYDYGPDGQTFTSPVTVSIKYDPDLMPAGMSASDLRLAWLAGNGIWEIISGSTVDETNNLVSGQTSHFSTYTVIVHERKPFGEQTGTFNSVIAYSNGTTGYTSNEYNTYDGYNTGMKWLCDEYVNRYYKQVYEKEIRIEGRKANDYYQNAAARGLTAYPNDGTEQPQVGDILVSEYGEYGHVAIVREVQNNKIFVIQQNWSDNGADDRYPITRSSNHVYPFDGKKGNYAVKGWLRCNHNTAYTISGQVTYQSVGLSGVTVTLTGTTSATVTTDAQGHYSFSNATNGSYTITASKTGYSFNPASIHATVNNDDLTDQDFTASANTYTISGKVSGDIISGVTITLTGSGSTTTTTDTSGNYSFTGAVNGNYTVTPSLAGYTFSPVSTAVTVDGANETGINFTSTLYVEPTYTVSGKISGDIQGGVIVTLTGGSTSSTTTDSGGNYSFSGLINGNYTITPSKTNYTFSPASRSVNLTGINVTGQNFTATENTYTISGTVSGAVVSGVTITLTGSGSTTTTTDGSGNYSFAGAKNGSYTITASKTGYTFSPASISATVSNANLTGQNFTSKENTYTIAGTVSGDVASGVTITLTGSGSVSTTTDSSGNYIFTGVKNGSYTITASKTGYNFSPASINATVSYADLTGQNFTATEYTYTVSGTVSGDIAANVTIALIGSGSSTTKTDSNGNYSFNKAKNGIYIILPSKVGYTFNPINIDATVSNADLPGQNFIATANTYSISGTVPCLTDVTVTLTGTSSRSTTIDSSGTFTFSGAKNGSYTITATKTGYTFSPISVTVNNADVTGKIFIVASAPSGSLDTNFGTCGTVRTIIGSYGSQAYSCAIQSDGKIVAVGYNTGTGGGFALARYNTDGSLDETFGSSGIVSTPISTRLNLINDIAIQSDGKIVAAGYMADESMVHYFALARYNADGSFDTTFGTNGIVKTLVGELNSTAFGVVLQSDGKIVVAGKASSPSTLHLVYGLARYNTNGTLDTTFGTNGTVLALVGTTTDDALNVALQSDGKIVMAGFSSTSSIGNPDYSVARFNTDGSLDTTFGTGGKVTTNILGIDTEASGLAIGADGKVVVAGWAVTPDSIDPVFGVVRYNTNGSLDTTFDVDGKVTTEIGLGKTSGSTIYYGDRAYAVAIQSDGKTVVAGRSWNDTTLWDIALVRYNVNGSLDTTFNSTGIVTTNVEAGIDAANSIAIQSDGKIVTAGFIADSGTNGHFGLARYWP